MRQALQLCAPGGRIYLREPVAVEQRLTLDRFFSKELEHEYSAVYRTVAELKDMLVQAGGGKGLRFSKRTACSPKRWKSVWRPASTS